MANKEANRKGAVSRPTAGKWQIARESRSGQFHEVSGRENFPRTSKTTPDAEVVPTLRYSDVQSGVAPRFVSELERARIVQRSDIRMIIPDRTLERRISANEPLKPEEADGIARLVRVVTHARRVFGDDRLADEWLRTANPALDGEIPIRMAATDVGGREVETILGRIEHGVFS